MSDICEPINLGNDKICFPSKYIVPFCLIVRITVNSHPCKPLVWPGFNVSYFVWFDVPINSGC